MFNFSAFSQRELHINFFSNFEHRLGDYQFTLKLALETILFMQNSSISFWRWCILLVALVSPIDSSIKLLSNSTFSMRFRKSLDRITTGDQHFQTNSSDCFE